MKVLDTSLPFFPTDIMQKKIAFFEHVYNLHLIDIFIIAIAAAMKLICHKVIEKSIPLIFRIYEVFRSTHFSKKRVFRIQGKLH